MVRKLQRLFALLMVITPFYGYSSQVNTDYMEEIDKEIDTIRKNTVKDALIGKGVPASLETGAEVDNTHKGVAGEAIGKIQNIETLRKAEEQMRNVTIQKQEQQRAEEKIRKETNIVKAMVKYAKEGRLKDLLTLLNTRPTINQSLLATEQDPETGHTVLIAAALSRHPDIIDNVLTIKGVDLNIQDKKGNTALHYAMGNKAIEAKLLKAGAKQIANKIGKDSYTPAETYAVVSKLVQAAKSGDVLKAERLINGNINLINLSDDATGLTPLQAALQAGEHKIAERFLELLGWNVDITQKDIRKKTLLDYAKTTEGKNLLKGLERRRSTMMMPPVNLSRATIVQSERKSKEEVTTSSKDNSPKKEKDSPKKDSPKKQDSPTKEELYWIEQNLANTGLFPRSSTVERSSVTARPSVSQPINAYDLFSSQSHFAITAPESTTSKKPESKETTKK